jgi:hypothetical protein
VERLTVDELEQYVNQYADYQRELKRQQ